ncbi:MAG: hypothetical protein ACU83N_08340 [Gammaproteobacteria bacterium]
MSFLTKFLLSIVIASSMGALSSVSFAAGKIENATTAEVKEEIEKAIGSTEEAIAAIQNGGNEEAVLKLIKNAKQASKRIESNRLDVKRNRAASKLAKARSAFKKGENDAAVALLSEALAGYQEIKRLF